MSNPQEAEEEPKQEAKEEAEEDDNLPGTPCTEQLNAEEEADQEAETEELQAEIKQAEQAERAEHEFAEAAYYEWKRRYFLGAAEEEALSQEVEAMQEVLEVLQANKPVSEHGKIEFYKMLTNCNSD